jgi:hypothetical protein
MKSPSPESIPSVSAVPDHDAVLRPAMRAELVLAREGAERRYAMFAVRALSPGGALLAGGLLLEMDEALTLDLVLDEAAPLRVCARVVGLHREVPGVEVAFSGLAEDDRNRIERKRIESRAAHAADI